MSVHFQYAGHVMNMRGRMEINRALSAKPDTRGIKVMRTEYIYVCWKFNFVDQMMDVGKRMEKELF